MATSRVPDSIPVLSRGKHRNPRKGACFMEFASFLAGERWSDHPACTHPDLAALARGVNDCVGDAARARLVPLIPDVVGLNGDDPHVGLLLARRCALVAVAVAPADRQQVLALGILRCDAELAAREGRGPGVESADVRRLREEVPHAFAWADDYVAARAGLPSSGTNVTRVLENAVVGITESTAADPDDLLVAVLHGAVDQCRAVLRPAPTPSRAPFAADPGRPAWRSRSGRLG